jgi:hypothetical protein
MYTQMQPWAEYTQNLAVRAASYTPDKHVRSRICFSYFKLLLPIVSG